MTAIERSDSDTGGQRSAPLAELVLVTAEACHLCERAREVLADLRRDLPFAVREVDLDSEEGRALLATWRFPFPPALGHDDVLIAHGRFSPRHLRRALRDIVGSP